MQPLGARMRTCRRAQLKPGAAAIPGAASWRPFLMRRFPAHRRITSSLPVLPRPRRLPRLRPAPCLCHSSPAACPAAGPHCYWGVAARSPGQAQPFHPRGRQPMPASTWPHGGGRLLSCCMAGACTLKPPAADRQICAVSFHAPSPQRCAGVIQGSPDSPGADRRADFWLLINACAGPVHSTSWILVRNPNTIASAQTCSMPHAAAAPCQTPCHGRAPRTQGRATRRPLLPLRVCAPHPRTRPPIQIPNFARRRHWWGPAVAGSGPHRCTLNLGSLAGRQPLKGSPALPPAPSYYPKTPIRRRRHAEGPGRAALPSSPPWPSALPTTRAPRPCPPIASVRFEGAGPRASVPAPPWAALAAGRPAKQRQHAAAARAARAAGPWRGPHLFPPPIGSICSDCHVTARGRQRAGAAARLHAQRNQAGRHLVGAFGRRREPGRRRAQRAASRAPAHARRQPTTATYAYPRPAQPQPREIASPPPGARSRGAGADTMSSSDMGASGSGGSSGRSSGSKGKSRRDRRDALLSGLVGAWGLGAPAVVPAVSVAAAAARAAQRPGAHAPAAWRRRHATSRPGRRARAHPAHLPPLPPPRAARLESELKSRQQQLVEETTRNTRAKVCWTAPGGGGWGPCGRRLVVRAAAGPRRAASDSRKAGGRARGGQPPAARLRAPPSGPPPQPTRPTSPPSPRLRPRLPPPPPPPRARRRRSSCSTPSPAPRRRCSTCWRSTRRAATGATPRRAPRSQRSTASSTCSSTRSTAAAAAAARAC
jgi:hypothetical protein